MAINKELILARGYATREELRELYNYYDTWKCRIVNDLDGEHRSIVDTIVYPLENQQVLRSHFRFVFESSYFYSSIYMPRFTRGMVGIAYTHERNYYEFPTIYVSHCLHMFIQAGVEAIEYAEASGDQ